MEGRLASWIKIKAVLKEYYAWCYTSVWMPWGKAITQSQLDSKLLTLDIDEGIRIERKVSPAGTKGKKSAKTRVGAEKMFVNRRATGTYVIQYGEKFYYMQNPKEVKAIINEKFPAPFVIWAY